MIKPALILVGWLIISLLIGLAAYMRPETFSFIP